MWAHLLIGTSWPDRNRGGGGPDRHWREVGNVLKTLPEVLDALDESGQRFAIAQIGGLCAERFEMIADLMSAEGCPSRRRRGTSV